MGNGIVAEREINPDVRARLRCDLGYFGSKDSIGIDKRGRILFPSKLRRMLEERLKIIGGNNIFFCLGERRDYGFIQMWDYHPNLGFETTFYETPLPDSKGGIVIPEELRNVIEGRVTFLPMCDHIEIWKKEHLEDYLGRIPISKT